MSIERISIVDSHTGGEPTRVVMSGIPDLGRGPLAERAKLFRQRHDRFRAAVVNEPRGSEVLVGALLVEPVDRESTAGAIFFNNVGVLGMCGHGTIGLVATLAHLGRIRPGEHRIETPVGDVTAILHENGRVSVRNVPSFRYAAGVVVEVPGYGLVTGDVAWGGNWFFLEGGARQRIEPGHVRLYSEHCRHIKAALQTAGITGENGAEIDHIELFGHAHDPANHGRNFVLCPGDSYDRSPCGTGTSAKLACLAADGKLAPGEVWRQESVIGSVFEGSYANGPEGQIIPTITGEAFITAEATLILDERDPFRDGISSV